MFRTCVIAVFMTIAGCGAGSEGASRGPTTQRARIERHDEVLNAWLEERDILGTSPLDKAFFDAQLYCFFSYAGWTEAAGIVL